MYIIYDPIGVRWRRARSGRNSVLDKKPRREIIFTVAKK
jgi:hypothetical protein